MAQRITKKQIDAMEKFLRKRPRTASELLKHSGGEYLPVLRKLGNRTPVLAKKVWDNGMRFKYWIRPGRMGKNWRRIYGTLQVPHSYDITINDFSVQSPEFEVE